MLGDALAVEQADVTDDERGLGARDGGDEREDEPRGGDDSHGGLRALG
jgi:hypothetical protein